MNQNKIANGAPNGADQPPVLYEDPKKIRRSPFNRTIDTKAPEFLELVESVRLHGVIEPPVVRRGVEGLELIAGERRTLAAIEARQTQIPVILRVATDLEELELILLGRRVGSVAAATHVPRTHAPPDRWRSRRSRGKPDARRFS